MTEIHILTGRILIEPERCSDCPKAPCIPACPNGILEPGRSGPRAALAAEKIKKGLCIECLACELSCHLNGAGGLTIELPLPPAAEGEA